MNPKYAVFYVHLQKLEFSMLYSAAQETDQSRNDRTFWLGEIGKKTVVGMKLDSKIGNNKSSCKSFVYVHFFVFKCACACLYVHHMLCMHECGQRQTLDVFRYHFRLYSFETRSIMGLKAHSLSRKLLEFTVSVSQCRVTAMHDYAWLSCECFKFEHACKASTVIP